MKHITVLNSLVAISILITVSIANAGISVNKCGSLGSNSNNDFTLTPDDGSSPYIIAPAPGSTAGNVGGFLAETDADRPGASVCVTGTLNPDSTLIEVTAIRFE
jgi:hypothetical protein